MRDDVRPAEAEAFAGAEDGGGVVRVEEAVEDDGDAGEAGGDHGLDTRLAIVGEEVPVETPVVQGRGITGLSDRRDKIRLGRGRGPPLYRRLIRYFVVA